MGKKNKLQETVKLSRALVLITIFLDIGSIFLAAFMKKSGSLFTKINVGQEIANISLGLIDKFFDNCTNEFKDIISKIKEIGQSFLKLLLDPFTWISVLAMAADLLVTMGTTTILPTMFYFAVNTFCLLFNCKIAFADSSTRSKFIDAVGIAGGIGTVLGPMGFALNQPILQLLGAIGFGLSALALSLRVFTPTNFQVVKDAIDESVEKCCGAQASLELEDDRLEEQPIKISQQNLSNSISQIAITNDEKILNETWNDLEKQASKKTSFSNNPNRMDLNGRRLREDFVNSGSDIDEIRYGNSCGVM